MRLSLYETPVTKPPKQSDHIEDMEGEGDGSNGGGVMPHQLVITNGTIIEEGKTRLCLGSEVINNKQKCVCYLKLRLFLLFKRKVNLCLLIGYQLKMLNLENQ